MKQPTNLPRACECVGRQWASAVVAAGEKYDDAATKKVGGCFFYRKRLKPLKVAA